MKRSCALRPPTSCANSPASYCSTAAIDASTRSLGIAVNGKDVGPDTNLGGSGGAIHRDGIEATWVERDFNFDAALLHPGANTIVLTVPAGPVASGICYDVVRLEVAPPTP